MDISQFDYELDSSLIAQKPIFPRDQSRLLACLDTVPQDFKFKDLPKILNSGDVFTANTSQIYFSTHYFNGYLVDSAPAVTAITEPISTSVSYTVPAGKRLYFLMNHNQTPVINGKDLRRSINNGTHPVILNSGDVLTGSFSGAEYFNGYLADENYFAGCGGGGSSSSASNVQNNGLYILSTSPNQSPYDYLSGELYTFNINYPTINHIVIPIGKVFKTNYKSINGNSNFTLYRGNEIIPDIPTYELEKMLLVENDSIVFDYNNNGNPSFFIINPLVTPFCFHLNDGDTYTVPSGKTAVMQRLDGGCVRVEFISGSINLQNQIAGSLKEYFPIWTENTQITISPYGGCSPGTIIAYGYGWYVDN